MRVAGMEVPILGSDSIKWIDITVPSSLNHIDNGTGNVAATFAPPTVDSASATYFDGDTPFYLIWLVCFLLYINSSTSSLLFLFFSYYFHNPTGESIRLNQML